MPQDRFSSTPTFDDWQDKAGDLGLRRRGKDLVGTCPGCGYGTDDGFVVRPSKRDSRALLFCNGCYPDKSERGRQSYRRIMEAAGFALTPSENAGSGPRPKTPEQRVEAALEAIDHALSEVSFAERFRSSYGMTNLRIRFADSNPKSAHWWNDETGWLTGDEAYSEAATIMRFVIEGAVAENHEQADSRIARWGKLSHIKGALGIAALDPTLRQYRDDWDPDPDFIGLPHGYKFHLVDGIDSRQVPRDWISTNAAVTPDPNCPTPNMDRVIQHMSNGDNELANFYWRMIGYCLFGHVREDIAFILCGEGGSGKTSFTLAAQYCLGDLATVLKASTLCGEREHGTFLMDLHRKRLAVVDEWKGQVLGDRFKSLTGHGKQKANRMRQDPVEFYSVATLLMVANPDDLPTLRNPDDAMQRRILIVPAGDRVAEQDPAVRAAILERELPGVMARMLEGAAEYAAEGLRPPAAAMEATRAYMAAASPYGQFIEDRCETGAFEEDAGTLYAEFVLWWKDKRFRGITPTQTKFGRALTNLGYPGRHSGRSLRIGLRLRTA